MNDPQPVQGDFPVFVEDTTEEPREEQYIVTGQHPVLEHRPGEVFTATLPLIQREYFLQYGQLAVVKDGKWEDINVTEDTTSQESEPAGEDETSTEE